MSKHMHEWRLTVGHSECKECHYSSIEGVAACVHCDDSIGPTEIERRLSATARLSKTSAIAASFAARDMGDKVSEEDLLAYAAALEGEDD